MKSNKYLIMVCFLFQMVVVNLYSKELSDVITYLEKNAIYSDNYPDIDYLAVGIASVIDDKGRQGDSCIVHFHPMYVIKDDSVAIAKKRILGQCNADPKYLVYAFGKYEKKELVLKTLSFFQNEILTPKTIENDTCRFYCTYNFPCPSEYNVFDLFTLRLLNYKDYPYEKLSKNEKRSIEILKERASLYLQTIGKKDSYQSLFKKKEKIHTTDLNAPYVALASILSMEMTKVNGEFQCELRLYERNAFKKKAFSEKFYSNDGLDVFFSRPSSLEEKKYFYAYKEGGCVPIYQAYFYQYVFGHNNEEGLLIIDSLKSTQDYAILNNQLVDFRMGVNFNDFWEFFLPEEFPLNKFFMSVIDYCNDCEGSYFYFSEKEQNEIVRNSKSIKKYCEE